MRARKIICSAEFGEGERQQVGVLEGRAAREPASIVFCFRWVSPHREGTDSMRFVGPCPWSESSGARTTEVVNFSAPLSAMEFLPKNHQDWGRED